MLYSLDTVERELTPAKVSLSRFLNFIPRTLGSWLINSYEDLDLKVQGLVSHISKEKTVFWQEDYDKLNKFIAILHKVEGYLPTSQFKVKTSIGSIIFNLEKLKEVAVNGEDLSATEYLNLTTANKEFLEKQISEVERISLPKPND